jgi:hypothetical protein
MAKVILDEFDRLPGIAQMSRTGVSKAMDVPSVRRKIRGDRIAGEERLDLTFPEPSLAADEQGIGPDPDVPADSRHGDQRLDPSATGARPLALFARLERVCLRAERNIRTRTEMTCDVEGLLADME